MIIVNHKLNADSLEEDRFYGCIMEGGNIFILEFKDGKLIDTKDTGFDYELDEFVEFRPML